MTVLAGFVLAVFPYGLASARFERTGRTAPMPFTASGAGMVLLPSASTELSLDRDPSLLKTGLGLVMTLFMAGADVFIRLLVEQPGYDALPAFAIDLAGGRLLRN